MESNENLKSLQMSVKEVNRNINFNRKTSLYRVKYGNSDDFDLLRVNCAYNGVVKSFEMKATDLPKDKDSIHFDAIEEENESFSIIWIEDVKYKIL